MNPGFETAMSVVLADDDPAVRQRLRAVAARDAALRVAGESAGGRAAIALLRARQPDVVMLDVEMPDAGGFEVVREVGQESMPVIVFLSDGTQAAVRAFDAGAVDYLVKPVDEARLCLALERAKQAAASRMADAAPRRAELLSPLRTQGPRRFPRTIAVRAGDVHRFVRVDDISHAEADGNHVKLHLPDGERTAHGSLAVMEGRLLDPERFVRIHRSTLVNVDHVSSAEPYFHGDLWMTLKSGVRLRCSRRYRARLQEVVPFTG